MKICPGSFAKIAGMVILVLSAAGCGSIPKQNLDRYISDFNSARNTAQDIYLSAQVQAEKSGDGTNKARVEVALKIRAVKARLAALDVIDQYNNALVKLATGSDPAGVKGSLDELSSGLSSFGIERISSLVADAVPYFGIISQAISLIDNAIKAERFAEAVAAAQKPVQGIIGILLQDADNLHEIQLQLLEKSRDPDRGRLLALRRKLEPLLNSLSADDEVAAASAAFNASLTNWATDPAKKPDPLTHAPTSARVANADDRALLQTMLNQANGLVASFNQTGEQIKAHQNLIEEYKKLLDSCSAAFVELNNAIREGRRASTLAFAINALNLRKAYLEVREAK